MSGEASLLDALSIAYPGVEPLRFAAPAGPGGQLDGVFALRVEAPMPHWLLVTRGLTELYGKETADPERSGFGFELTCRLPARSPTYDFGWAINWLAALADALFQGTASYEPGSHQKLLDPGGPDELCGVAFIEDLALAPTRSDCGAYAFLQVVALTEGELEAARRWQTRSLLALILAREPLGWMDPTRRSWLADPAFARAVAEGTAQQGSATAVWQGGGLLWLVWDDTLSVHLDTSLVDAVLRGLADRVSHGRPMLFVGDPRQSSDGRESVHAAQTVVGLRPGPSGWTIEDAGGTPIATVSLSAESVHELAAALRPVAAAYAVPGLPRVRFVVVPPERLADWRYPW